MELTLEQALQKGIEAHKAGKAQEADRYYTAILKANPKHPDANHNMAVLAVGVGKVQESLPFFKIALEANAGIAQYWLSYIDALIKLDRLDDAKTVFDQAKSNGAKGDPFDQLEKKLGVSTSQNPKPQEPSQAQMKPLIALYSQGQFEQALDEALKLLVEFPNSVNLYNITGASNKALGKLDEAVDAFKKAISINPEFAEAYNNLGIVMRDQGKLDEAIVAYKKAIAINPNYAQAYSNLGIVFKNQGKPQEAIKAFKEALNIHPNSPEIYISMGNIHNNQGKANEAIKAFESALNLKPTYAEAHFNIANCLNEKRQYEEAIDAYKKAIDINPDYSEAYHNMGTAHHKKGKLEKAIKAYSKAVAIQPDYAIACENLLMLRNQLQATGLKIEHKTTQSNSVTSALVWRPKYQIYQAIYAFLKADHNLVKKHLKDFSNCDPKLIAKLELKDRVFCTAYNGFLTELIKTHVLKEPPTSGHQTVFHIGESHCLSYAHKTIKIHGMEYNIAPRITFGAKAYHFSREEMDAFKAITKSNLDSLPRASQVLLSFGEIDCRPDEGFISTSSKRNKPIEDLIHYTVLGFINWFFEKNKKNNHSLYFFNVPAPVYQKKFNTRLNKEAAKTVKLFNHSLDQHLLKL